MTSSRTISIPDNPYLLLTPGPLSTSFRVKEAMLRDWCTWDSDYKAIVETIRANLVRLAGVGPEDHTAVLMQGSGTFAVESVITTAVPAAGKLLVLANGAYGMRMARIARQAGIATVLHDSDELGPPDTDRLRRCLDNDKAIGHVAVVHCETTTGMLNPVEKIGRIVKAAGRVFIVDAMSSFGGIPMQEEEIGADFLISSANKCIQGVPGFGFVIARRLELEKCRNRARSYSLDLYDQWQVMETQAGKWRFTSPTHVVRAFSQALEELDEEGGVEARHRRYHHNQQLLVDGMARLGFRPVLHRAYHSPIITAFHSPQSSAYRFDKFYALLKHKGFVIYPGKVTNCDSFRIGTIGTVDGDDIHRLLEAVETSMFWRKQ